MIEFDCSACGKRLRVADSLGGKKGKCPQCGSIVNVPDNVPLLTAVPATALSRPAEHPVTVWQPSHKYYLGWYILGGVLVLAFGLGIIIIVWAVLDRKHARYILTSRTLSVQRGIIGRQESEIRLTDVRNISLYSRAPERLMGIGNVGVASAATGGVELQLTGLANPDAVRKQIAAAVESVRE